MGGRKVRIFSRVSSGGVRVISVRVGWVELTNAAAQIRVLYECELCLSQRSLFDQENTPRCRFNRVSGKSFFDGVLQADARLPNNAVPFSSAGKFEPGVLKRTPSIVHAESQLVLDFNFLASALLGPVGYSQ